MSRHDSPPLSMRQAATYVGWTGRRAGHRMREALLRVEKHLGREVMARIGLGTKRQRCVVTLSILRRYLPELFARRDHLPDAIEQAFADHARRGAETFSRTKALGARIRQLAAENSALEIRIVVLERAANRAT